MTIEEQTKADLIKYRLEQARETIDVVDLLMRNDKLSTAVNRIYYGMFYSYWHLLYSLTSKPLSINN
jgi:uncharacterized protein (UPF0332 family)